MELTNNEVKLEDLIKNGDVKQTGPFVIDKALEYKPSIENIELIKEILILYRNYISSLSLLEEYKENFLEALRKEETKKNQMLEDIDPFVISILMKTYPHSATMIAIDKKHKNIKLTKETLCKMNGILINGLNKGDKIHGFRKSNNSFVGTKIGKTKNISYIPIDYKQIEQTAKTILNIYNENIKKEEEILIKPMIIHALVAALQMFKDANTRLARILQHIEFWDLSSKFYSLELPTPALFTSESLFNKRDEYRELIKEIAINPNNEAFDNWITFNALIFEKQIYKNQDKLEKCHKAFK